MRFDRIQQIAHDFLRAAKIRLTEDYQEVFDDWLGTYLFSRLRLDSPLHEYWALLREQNVDVNDIPQFDPT